jgi:spermidine synthase
MRSTSRPPRSTHASALLLMALSGFAALGYQIVWTRQNALWLGHETAAILAVVGAIFGGMALGSWSLARRIDASAHPARWYVGCEIAIAVWGLVLALSMAPLSGLLLAWLGPHPAPAWNAVVVFCGTFVLLLPATAAMGATLPAMERMLAGLPTQRAPIASLYASNTAGAVAGVLCAAFVFVPALGLTLTATLCAAANLLCAALAWTIFPSSAPARAASTAMSAHRRMAQLAPLAVTGFLGIGYEVLVVRVLSQVTENTVYTFAMLLAVYLIGTALGAALYARLSGTAPFEQVRDRLMRATAVSCLAGVLALAFASALRAALLARLGTGMAAALTAEALLATVAFLPPAVVMGALFSHLAAHARAGGVRFGHALGVNTAAAACAPPSFGLALPWLGTTGALLIVAAGYLLLATPRAWRSLPQLATAAVALALAAWAPTLGAADVPAGGRLVSRVEGTGATVSVVADRFDVVTLHINNRQQEGSSATWFADARQGVLPLLLHPKPVRALFLGIGTGMTARAAAEHPGVHVDAVELLPEVVDATRHFAPDGAPPPPRLHVRIADARRFVRAADTRYDVIVADNFHPARAGSAALYTVEHFAAVRARLAARGVFCQWLPLHQLDRETLRSIVRSFTHVYPQSWALLATHSLDTPVLGLVARRDGARFAALGNAQRTLPTSDALGLANDLAVFGTFLAGPASLARFSAGAALNTDDRPVVAYLAPRITYSPGSTPSARMLALLREVQIAPEELVAGSDSAAWNRRLAAYWAARDRYLEIGSTVRRTADVTQMLAQVRQPLLDVLDISAEFEPAYDPLLHMATELAQRDARAARVLLTRLAEIQPQREETRAALEALAGAAL